MNIQHLYQDYPEIPYISPERDLAQWEKDLTDGSATRVPKRNMLRTEEGLLPGDIILLWRIQLGTFTTETVFPKYFEYDYGIDAPAHLIALQEEGYALQLPASQSMDHITAKALKNILKQKGVKGYSSLNKKELEQLTLNKIDTDDLEKAFEIRGIALTPKGEAALLNNQAILDRHPMKAMYKK